MADRARQPEQATRGPLSGRLLKNREVPLAGRYFCIVNGGSLGGPQDRWKYCKGNCHTHEGGIVPALRPDRRSVQGLAIRPACRRNPTIDSVGHGDAGKTPDLTWPAHSKVSMILPPTQKYNPQLPKSHDVKP